MLSITILGNAHRLDQVDILMNGDDAQRERLLGAGESGQDAASISIVPESGAMHPGYDLGERGFAGAVLTNETVSPARNHGEIHAAKRSHGCESCASARGN